MRDLEDLDTDFILQKRTEKQQKEPAYRSQNRFSE